MMPILLMAAKRVVRLLVRTDPTEQVVHSQVQRNHDQIRKRLSQTVSPHEGVHFRRNMIPSLRPKGAASGSEHHQVAWGFGCGSKIGAQKGTLVNGNLDYNLRSPGCFILTHTHLTPGSCGGKWETFQPNHQPKPQIGEKDLQHLPFAPPFRGPVAFNRPVVSGIGPPKMASLVLLASL